MATQRTPSRHHPRVIRPTGVSPIDPGADRGRMLFVDDIQAIFGTKPDGKPRKTAWWVTHKFAPEFKRKAGRDCFWYEAEARAWIDAQRANT